MELFSFPFLFPNYCHSVVHHIIIFIIVIIIIILPESFLHLLVDDFSQGFEWPHVSSGPKTFLSTLVDLNNAVVWIVSTRPLICVV